MSEYWLDGYNLILRRTRPRASATLEESRQHLLRSVSTLEDPVRVFFDAARFGGGYVESNTVHPRVQVVFVRQGSADDAMVRTLREKGGRGITLVTDDRELALRARQLGALTLHVDKFLAHLERVNSPLERRPGQYHRASDNKERPSSVSSRKVDDWLEFMGLDEGFTLNDDGSSDDSDDPSRTKG